MSLPAHSQHHHSFLYRKVMLPLLALLRMGASPQKLAWSIALGVVIGVNPLLGFTTLVCLGLALLFRLNLPASQLANHLMYPLEIALLYPFLRLGALAFRTGPIPLAPKMLFAQAHSRPWALIKSLWMWEWHALVLWGLISIILLPILAAVLNPVLQRMLLRVEAHHATLLPTI